MGETLLHTVFVCSRGVLDEDRRLIDPTVMSIYVKDYFNKTLTIDENFFTLNVPQKAWNKFEVYVMVSDEKGATGRSAMGQKVNKNRLCSKICSTNDIVTKFGRNK